MTSFSEWMGAGGPDQAQQDLSVPEPARDFQGERAGFATRLAASIIDVAIVSLVMFLVWFTLAILQLIFTPGVDVELPGMGTLVIWGYAFTTVYWTFSWANTGRSIGAWAMGVRVVSPRGKRLGYFYAFLRAAFCVGFPFGLLWALISRRNRSVQDAVLRTIVIYDWALRPAVIIGRPD